MELPTFRFNIWLDQYVEYNCSTQVDWHTKGVSRPYFGLLCIIYGLIIIPPYIVCALTLFATRSQSVCKIMFYLAVADIADLLTNSLAFGVMLIRGEVYCAHPHFQICFSMAAEFFFLCSTFSCFLLALNRFGELLSIRPISGIFRGSRTWHLLLLCTVPVFFVVLFTPPFLFNSTHHMMFADPMIHHGRFLYSNVVHVACITVTPTCSLLIYLTMLVGLLREYGNIWKSSSALNRATFQILVQSGIIILIHLTTCITFEIVQFLPASAVDSMLFLVHFGWMLVNGSPPIVYLVFDRTMRQALLDRLRGPFESGQTTRVVMVSTTIPPF